MAVGHEKARGIARAWQSQPTVEGAGVHLRRAFGNEEEGQLDPFLLLDDFRGERPADYTAGFPWHPHRGIETITYVLEGRVEHGDSLGNQGVIGPGDVQWMTAGSGIMHQEMPKGNERGRLSGFQLWANLPAANKMMDPRYREVKQADIPVVRTDEGATVRVVCGQVRGTVGPVQDVIANPEYLDVLVPARAFFSHLTQPGHTVFAYVFEGEGYFDAAAEQAYGNHTVLLFENSGQSVVARTRERAVRFLLVSGQPLREPIAWAGPIVMNTREELREAFLELKRGTFVRHGANESA